MMNNKKLFNFTHQALFLCFQAIFLITPFVFTWVNDELFEFNKMLFIYAMTGLATGFWLTKMILAQKIIYKHSWLNSVVLLFLGSQILSTLFSIEPRTSFFGYYTRFNGGLLSIICYTLLYLAVVSNFAKDQLKKLLLSSVVAGFLVAVYSIPEHYGHSPSCFLITQQFNVDCWVQDVQSRIFGTFGQPNWLAAFAVGLAPLSLVFMGNNKKELSFSSVKIFAIISFILLILTTLFTQSRSGFLSLLAGIGFYLGSSSLLLVLQQVFAQNEQHNEERSTATATTANFWQKLCLEILLPTILLITVSFVFGTPYSAPFLQKTAAPQIETIPSAGGNSLEIGGTDSGEIRKIVWKGAWQVWQRYPILGSGVETFAYSYYQDRPMEHNLVSEWDFLYNKAHNEFLNFLATTGLVGFTSYLLLLAAPVIYALIWIAKNFKDKSKTADSLLLLALIGAIFAMSLSNFFGFSTVMVNILLFFFLACIAIISNSNAPKTETAPNLNTSLDLTQSLQLGIMLLILLASLNWVYQTWLADKYYATGKNYIKSTEYITGLNYLQRAQELSPKEPFFSDELADLYSKMAIQYSQAGEATQSSQLAAAAIQTSEYTLKLNSRHLNFYKTQSRIFITLSQLNVEFLRYAKQSLQAAIKIAPTDAKLMYNLGIVELGLEETEQGLADLRKTVEMKPNYATARLALAKQLEKQQDYQGAKEQYLYILEKIAPDSVDVAQRLKAIEASQSAVNK